MQFQRHRMRTYPSYLERWKRYVQLGVTLCAQWIDHAFAQPLIPLYVSTLPQFPRFKFNAFVCTGVCFIFAVLSTLDTYCRVVPGADPNGAPVESLGAQTGDEVTWVVDLAAGACFLSLYMHSADLPHRNIHRVHSQ